MNRDEFFAQLQKLSPKEIEARLSSGDRERLVLVHEFLQQNQSKEAPSGQLVRAATDASWAAVQGAAKAETRATFAIIISVVATLAALASAVIAFLGLKHQRAEPARSLKWRREQVVGFSGSTGAGHARQGNLLAPQVTDLYMCSNLATQIPPPFRHAPYLSQVRRGTAS